MIFLNKCITTFVASELQGYSRAFFFSFVFEYDLRNVFLKNYRFFYLAVLTKTLVELLQKILYSVEI